MRSSIRYSLLAFAILTQTGLASAEPFEVRNFRQGMSIVHIQHVAETSGYTVRPEKQPGFFTVLDGNKEIISLNLCKDHLFNAFWLVSGGFDRFVKLLDSLAKQGLKKTDVSWKSFIGYDGKEHFDITVYFVPPGLHNEYYVKASLFASEEHGTTNSQITYSAVDGYCK